MRRPWPPANSPPTGEPKWSVPKPLYLAKHRISVTKSEQHVVISSPVSTIYAWNALDHDPPFGDQLRIAFYELGLWRSLVTRIYSCLQLNTAVRKSAITNIKSSNNLVVTNQRLVKTDTLFNQEWKESSGPSFALEASKVTVK